MKAKTPPKQKIPESYFKLVMDFPLISIKSEKQLRAAQGMMDRLLAKGLLDPGEHTYLEALSDLVETYENEKYPFAPPTDAEKLKHLMAVKDVSQAELCRNTGISRSTIRNVLAHKEPFSEPMVHTLADYFGVNPNVFVPSLFRDLY